MTTVTSIEQLQDEVRGRQRVRVSGAGTKPALSDGADLSLAGLTGITEYDPHEFTFTALAGTPLSNIRQRLAENGQYLPFDPPLVAAGATIGGTVAAGLSGSGRYRYGGLRDFILGVRLVTGTGQLVVGGGKVVKNAAGFDLPKLVVGSLGQMGIVAEATFKVFPEPAAYATLAVDFANVEAAVGAMARLATQPFQLHAMDLEPPRRLWLRIGGTGEALALRLARIKQFLGLDGESWTGDEERQLWQQVGEFQWVDAGQRLVKTPMSGTDVVRMESWIDELAVELPRRYCVGGHLLWLAWPAEQSYEKLEAFLHEFHRPALALTGSWPNPVLGPHNGEALAKPLRAVIDPEGKLQR